MFPSEHDGPTCPTRARARVGKPPVVRPRQSMRVLQMPEGSAGGTREEVDVVTREEFGEGRTTPRFATGNEASACVSAPAQRVRNSVSSFTRYR
jgi:hypothetical protein